MGERKGYRLCLLVALWFLLLWSAKVSLLWELLGVELALALALAMETFLQQSLSSGQLGLLGLPSGWQQDGEFPSGDAGGT